MSDELIRISEIFGPTIQGEGALIGQPTVFVRTGGCDYRCSWCDTAHAVDKEFRQGWKPMTAKNIFLEIEKLSGETPLTVSLSGGNPAIQNFQALIDMGQARNYRFALETQGSIAQDWFADLDVLTLSPKPPSSDMNVDWSAFDKCIEAASYKPAINLKFVILDGADYTFARETAAKYPNYPVYLQPCNHTPPTGHGDDEEIDMDGIHERLNWLIEKTLQDKWYEAHILPQLHVMLWGNKKGV